MKYCLQQLLGSLHDSELGRNFLNNATIRDLCLVFRYSELYEARLLQLTGKVRPDQRFGEKVDKVGQEASWERKVGEKEVTEIFCSFVRGHYGDNNNCRQPKV